MGFTTGVGSVSSDRLTLPFSLSNPKRVVLQDAALNEQLRTEGYVHIPGFALPEAIHGLRKQLLALDPEDGFEAGKGLQDFHCSWLDPKRTYRQQVYELLYGTLQPYIDQVVVDYTPYITNLFVKQPHRGQMHDQQKWSFVDEEQYRSISVWTPLVDAHPGNGALSVIPRSHIPFARKRGFSIPWELRDLYEIFPEKYLQPLTVPVGDAIILDDALIHAAGKNNTDDIRVATQIIMGPKEAQGIHPFKISDEEVKVFAADKDFYLDFDVTQSPANQRPALASYPYQEAFLSETDYLDRMKQAEALIL